MSDDDRLERINRLIHTFPNKPGVYVIYDKEGKIIYIGKAIDLVKRLHQHFAPSTNFSKSRIIRERAEHIEVHVVNNENEALLLEYNMIKEHMPPLNERWKDGKTYPYLEITTGEKYPRLQITREKINSDSIYLGPFSDVNSLRNSIRHILRLFPVANCNKKINLGDARTWARTCMRRRTKQCMRPCEVEVDEDEYKYNIQQIINFFEGKLPEIVDDLNNRMKKASEQLNFEEAAKYRDILKSVKRSLEQQKVMLSGVRDGYYLSHISDSQETCISLIKIYDNRLVRQVTQTISNDEIAGRNNPTWIDFVMNFLINTLHLYDSSEEKGRIVIDTKKPKSIIKSLKNFGYNAGEPQDNIDNQLIAMARQYARSYMKRRALLRMDELKPHERVLDLQHILNLEQPPMIIDTFDVSTLMGKNNVASCVRFVNGVPEKKAYRRFKIRSVFQQDDFASMEEAVYRRYRHVKNGIDEKGLPQPDLIVIDGGAEQVKRALESINRLRLNIPIIGLAKKEEEIYLPGKKDPIKESKNRLGILLLRASRDEAHRFAVKYQRKLREQEGLQSILDNIKGIGTTRKEKLLAKYKSVGNIAKQSSETVSKEVGISQQLASEVIAACRKFILN